MSDEPAALRSASPSPPTVAVVVAVAAFAVAIAPIVAAIATVSAVAVVTVVFRAAAINPVPPKNHPRRRHRTNRFSSPPPHLPW